MYLLYVYFRWSCVHLHHRLLHGHRRHWGKVSPLSGHGSGSASSPTPTPTTTSNTPAPTSHHSHHQHHHHHPVSLRPIDDPPSLSPLPLRSSAGVEPPHAPSPSPGGHPSSGMGSSLSAPTLSVPFAVPGAAGRSGLGHARKGPVAVPVWTDWTPSCVVSS
jgi:hypothetical protein